MQRRYFVPLCAALLLLTACDQQTISELEEGLSTESDVRMKFGEPDAVWQEPNGSHTLEYARCRGN